MRTNLRNAGIIEALPLFNQYVHKVNYTSAYNDIFRFLLSLIKFLPLEVLFLRLENNIYTLSPEDQHGNAYSVVLRCHSQIIQLVPQV